MYVDDGGDIGLALVIMTRLVSIRASRCNELTFSRAIQQSWWGFPNLTCMYHQGVNEDNRITVFRMVHPDSSNFTRAWFQPMTNGSAILTGSAWCGFQCGLVGSSVAMSHQIARKRDSDPTSNRSTGIYARPDTVKSAWGYLSSKFCEHLISSGRHLVLDLLISLLWRGFDLENVEYCA